MASTDMTISERVAASRAKQGLPPKITDPQALARIAAVVRNAEGRGHVV